MSSIKLAAPSSSFPSLYHHQPEAADEMLIWWSMMVYTNLCSKSWQQFDIWRGHWVVPWVINAYEFKMGWWKHYNCLFQGTKNLCLCLWWTTGVKIVFLRYGWWKSTVTFGAQLLSPMRRAYCLTWQDRGRFTRREWACNLTLVCWEHSVACQQHPLFFSSQIFKLI